MSSLPQPIKAYMDFVDLPQKYAVRPFGGFLAKQGIDPATMSPHFMDENNRVQVGYGASLGSVVHPRVGQALTHIDPVGSASRMGAIARQGLFSPIETAKDPAGTIDRASRPRSGRLKDHNDERISDQDLEDIRNAESYTDAFDKAMENRPWERMGTEVAADPLNLILGAGWAAKAVGAPAKLAQAGRAGKAALETGSAVKKAQDTFDRVAGAPLLLGIRGVRAIGDKFGWFERTRKSQATQKLNDVIRAMGEMMGYGFNENAMFNVPQGRNQMEIVIRGGAAHQNAINHTLNLRGMDRPQKRMVDGEEIDIPASQVEIEGDDLIIRSDISEAEANQLRRDLAQEAMDRRRGQGVPDDPDAPELQRDPADLLSEDQNISDYWTDMEGPPSDEVIEVPDELNLESQDVRSPQQVSAEGVPSPSPVRTVRMQNTDEPLEGHLMPGRWRAIAETLSPRSAPRAEVAGDTPIPTPGDMGRVVYRDQSTGQNVPQHMFRESPYLLDQALPLEKPITREHQIHDQSQPLRPRRSRARRPDRQQEQPDTGEALESVESVVEEPTQTPSTQMERPHEVYTYRRTPVEDMETHARSVDDYFQRRDRAERRAHVGEMDDLTPEEKRNILQSPYRIGEEGVEGLSDLVQGAQASRWSGSVARRIPRPEVKVSQAHGREEGKWRVYQSIRGEDTQRSLRNRARQNEHITADAPPIEKRIFLGGTDKRALSFEEADRLARQHLASHDYVLPNKRSLSADYLVQDDVRLADALPSRPSALVQAPEGQRYYSDQREPWWETAQAAQRSSAHPEQEVAAAAERISQISERHGLNMTDERIARVAERNVMRRRQGVVRDNEIIGNLDMVTDDYVPRTLTADGNPRTSGLNHDLDSVIERIDTGSDDLQILRRAGQQKDARVFLFDETGFADTSPENSSWRAFELIEGDSGVGIRFLPRNSHGTYQQTYRAARRHLSSARGVWNNGSIEHRVDNLEGFRGTRESRDVNRELQGRRREQIDGPKETLDALAADDFVEEMRRRPRGGQYDSTTPQQYYRDPGTGDRINIPDTLNEEYHQVFRSHRRAVESAIEARNFRGTTLEDLTNVVDNQSPEIWESQGMSKGQYVRGILGELRREGRIQEQAAPVSRQSPELQRDTRFGRVLNTISGGRQLDIPESVAEQTRVRPQIRSLSGQQAVDMPQDMADPIRQALQRSNRSRQRWNETRAGDPPISEPRYFLNDGSPVRERISQPGEATPPQQRGFDETVLDDAPVEPPIEEVTEGPTLEEPITTAEEHVETLHQTEFLDDIPEGPAPGPELEDIRVRRTGQSQFQRRLHDTDGGRAVDSFDELINQGAARAGAQAPGIEQTRTILRPYMQEYPDVILNETYLKNEDNLNLLSQAMQVEDNRERMNLLSQFVRNGGNRWDAVELRLPEHLQVKRWLTDFKRDRRLMDFQDKQHTQTNLTDQAFETMYGGDDPILVRGQRYEPPRARRGQRPDPSELGQWGRLQTVMGQQSRLEGRFDRHLKRIEDVTDNIAQRTGRNPEDLHQWGTADLWEMANKHGTQQEITQIRNAINDIGWGNEFTRERYLMNRYIQAGHQDIARQFDLTPEDETALQRIGSTMTNSYGYLMQLYKEQALVDGRWHGLNAGDMSLKMLIEGNPRAVFMAPSVFWKALKRESVIPEEMFTQGIRDVPPEVESVFARSTASPEFQAGAMNQHRAYISGRQGNWQDVKNQMERTRTKTRRDSKTGEVLSESHGVAAGRIPFVGAAAGPIVDTNRHIGTAMETSVRGATWYTMWDRALREEVHPEFMRESLRALRASGADEETQQRVLSTFNNEGTDLTGKQIRRVMWENTGNEEATHHLSSWWHQQSQRASQRSAEEAQRVHFPIGDERVIEENLGLKYWFPFHVWATRNVPYYTATLAHNPWLLRAANSYVDASDQEKENFGLTSRFQMKQPVDQVSTNPITEWFLGEDNEVWVNPTVMVSLFDQVKPGMNRRDPTLMDRILSSPEGLGIGVAPWFQVGANVLGYSSDPDPSRVTRHSRLAQGLTGHDPGRITGDPIRKLRGELSGRLPGSRELSGDTVHGSSHMDYMVNREIVHLSLENTGRPDDPDHMAAIYDPEHPIHQEAFSRAHKERAFSEMWGFALPTPIATARGTERDIRTQMAEYIGDDMQPEDWSRLQEHAPEAMAYTNIPGDADEAQLQAALSEVTRLRRDGEKINYDLLFEQYPLFKEFLAWRRSEPDKSSIQDFLGRT